MNLSTRSPLDGLRSRVLAISTLVLYLILLPAWAVDVVKSPNDKRSYQALVLENGLKVLLISDPSTDKAAASLDVNVGNGSDPESRQGLAHFLEHMLFLGTEKYPDPGEYKDFISEHGGSQNAYTTFDHTNYFFDVDKDHFEPALDRFAQFFIKPLFNERYVTRERQVVNSEFLSGIKSDGRRIFSASKEVMNPAHPYTRFPVGSLTTLADRPSDPVRDDLIGFYRSHYSAGLMTLVVLGKEPLPTLRDWVTRKFSPVPNTGAEPLQISQRLYLPERLPVRLDVVPVKEQRSLSLSFPIPPVESHYKNKPVSHIAHLLGHEGNGSLLSLLREKGWADGLSAGTGYDHPSEATFNVSIKLTRSGVEHLNDVIGYVFQFIELIRKRGLEAWIFEENRKLANIQFRFRESPPPLSYVRGLAAALHVYPPEDVLRGPFVYERFDAELIRTYLDRLRPENMVITVVSSEAQTDSLTARYETPYKIRPLDDSRVRGWRVSDSDIALSIPQPNIFIPDDLAIKELEAQASIPKRVSHRPGVELWHQQDQTFKTPRADFYVSVRSKAANNSPRNDALSKLYVGMVNDQLTEFSYPADLAGLSYSLYRHIRGFTIRVSGYSAKQDVLLKRIVEALATPKLDPQRFQIIKQDIIRSLKNRRENRPYERALDDLRDLLIDPQWTDDAQLAATEQITLEELRSYAGRFDDELEVVMLSHGNVHVEDSRKLAEIVRAGLLTGTRPAEVPRGRLVKLDPGDRYLRELETAHEESAAVIYFQGADRSLRSRANAALLGQIISPAFFQQLRTEKQLGYIVFASSMTLFEVPGLALVVQSPLASAEALTAHMETFIKEFQEVLKTMENPEFQRNKAALIGNILEEETQLQERTNRYWNELDRDHLKFDLREQLAAAVESVTLEDLQEFYRSYLLNESRMQLNVLAASNRHANDAPAAAPLGAADAILVQDPAVFKTHKAFFPP